MTEATNDQLQEIANFLNAHMRKIRDLYPTFEGFDNGNNNTSSTGYAIDETAIGHTINVSTSGSNGTLVTMFPFVKYPLNSNYATLYPKLTAYLTNKLPNLKNNTFLMNALKTYGSLNDSQIEEALTWGTGTTIEVTNMPCCWAAYGPLWGFDTNTIVLSTDLVNLIENNTTIDTDVLDFFIAIVILHEHTHLGDFLYNGDMYDGEEGDDFEMVVTGTS